MILGLMTVGLFLVKKAYFHLFLAVALALLPMATGISWYLCRPALLGVLPLAALTLVFQALWGPPPYAWTFSLQGLEEGGLMALRLLDLAWLAQLLALTTSPIRMCDALEGFFRPLGWMGVPYRDLALAFTIAWRFIPILALEGDRLLKAQISRGAAWEEGSLWRRVHTLVGLLTPLLIRCFRYAEDLALALEARGYGRVKHPTRLYPLVWSGLDSLALVVALALLGGLVAWERL